MRQKIPVRNYDEHATNSVALVGIDWADHKHDVCLALPDGRSLEHSTIEHTPEALAAWVSQLQTRFGSGQIAIALEQSRGPLLYALCRYANLVLSEVRASKLSRICGLFDSLLCVGQVLL